MILSVNWRLPSVVSTPETLLTVSVGDTRVRSGIGETRCRKVSCCSLIIVDGETVRTHKSFVAFNFLPIYYPVTFRVKHIEIG